MKRVLKCHAGACGTKRVLKRHAGAYGTKRVLNRHAGACGCHPTVVNSRSRSSKCSEQSGRRTKTGLVKTGLVKTGLVKSGLKTEPGNKHKHINSITLLCLLACFVVILVFYVNASHNMSHRGSSIYPH
jgi:hypothetical protein